MAIKDFTEKAFEAVLDSISLYRNKDKEKEVETGQMLTEEVLRSGVDAMDSYWGSDRNKVYVVTRRGYKAVDRDRSAVHFDLDAVFTSKDLAQNYLEEQMKNNDDLFLYHISEMSLDVVSRKELVFLQTILYGLRTYPREESQG
jgi:hypothetical protein